MANSLEAQRSKLAAVFTMPAHQSASGIKGHLALHEQRDEKLISLPPLRWAYGERRVSYDRRKGALLAGDEVVRIRK